jgi:opacity protein-like surface antigen
MRVLRSGLLACGIAVSLSSIALADMAYLGLRGSYVMAEDAGSTSIFIDDTRRFDDGWAVAGVVGFVLDQNMRIELEGGHRSNTISDVFLIRNDIDPPTEGAAYTADGHVDMGFGMVNLFYDLHIPDVPLLPWVGVGAGGAYVNHEIYYSYGDPNNPIAAKDSDWQFAYQLMAGVTMPVAEAVSMSFGYRYFATEDLTFVDIYGDEFKTELTNQSIDIGFQWHI